MKSLPPSELKLLANTDFDMNEISTNSSADKINNALAVPPEEIAYENLAEKSHFDSLRDQLIFSFQPVRRNQYEDYISQQAHISGYKTLVTSNLQKASDMAVANLYHYFKIRDESNKQKTVLATIA